MVERRGLRALAERLREGKKQRDHRDQQRDALFSVLVSAWPAAAVLVMLELVLDLVLHRVHTLAHLASPVARISEPDAVYHARGWALR